MFRKSCDIDVFIRIHLVIVQFHTDLISSVDYLIDKGIADPDRFGIGGWSYGGYMAAWAVTQTSRFKAAVAGAPMTDLASEYGTELALINAYDTWYLGNPNPAPHGRK